MFERESLKILIQLLILIDLLLTLPNQCKAYFHSFFCEATGYELDVRWIPRSKQIDCPLKARYRERFRGCSCGSYCSWDLCRANVAPSDCLAETGSEWKWDLLKNAWVAQIINGITILLRSSSDSKVGDEY